MSASEVLGTVALVLLANAGLVALEWWLIRWTSQGRR